MRSKISVVLEDTEKPLDIQLLQDECKVHTNTERGNAKALGAGTQDRTLTTTEMLKVFMVRAKNVCVKLKKPFLAKKYQEL